MSRRPQSSGLRNSQSSGIVETPTEPSGTEVEGKNVATEDVKPRLETLPTYDGESQHPKPVGRFGHLVRPGGESGRSGFHPYQFLMICFRSSNRTSKMVNRFWPLIPAAFALHWARPDQTVANFILPYLSMIPAANLLGFSSGQFARKLPHVPGTIFEITMGSVVEIVLFIVLIKEGDRGVPIIKSAILGSILANLLFCLGLCFIAGGLHGRGTSELEFHEAISEVGSNLMLVSVTGLILPSIFSVTLSTTEVELSHQTLQVSRATAILLLVSYFIYMLYMTRSHQSIFSDLFADEEKIERSGRSTPLTKLTATEALVALAFSLTIVCFMAVFLVQQIDYLVVQRGVKEAFLGLILVPLAEKLAEHLSAVDEAFDNKPNMALSHVMGSSIQTALLTTPLIVFIGWGLNIPMDLNFPIFDSAVLVLSILVVGNFLRDQKSNYLEGALCVIVYIIIAVATIYYPNATTEAGGAGNTGETSH